nr:hypothetical protein [Tanacetum cinerariifolium]
MTITSHKTRSNTTFSSSPNQLLEEFADELSLITFPMEYDDDLQFDIESIFKEIEYLLRHDPIKDIGSSLKDSIDQSNLADLDNNLVDSMLEMFADEHALDYSSSPIFNEYDDDLFEVKSDTKIFYDDPFDTKGEKIKESKILIDELDLSCDFLPFEYDSIFSEDFSRVDALSSTKYEDKVFNPEAAEAIRLRAQASNFEAVEKSLRDETNALKERNAILEKEQNALDVKVTELEASVVGKERKLTDLNALITSVKSQNDILVDRVYELEISSSGLQEKVTLYENCMDQLEKFQDDQKKVVNDKCLLTHGIKLAIVKFLNSPECLFALGAAIGKAIEKGMQDGLSVGIVHGKEGKVLTDVAAHNPSAEVYYTSTLIKENITNQRSALRDVFVPLAEPFSAAVLTGTEGPSDSATANANMALSTTFASASSIAPIAVDDYEVVGAEDQAVTDENVSSFPNVDDAELNIRQ